MRTIPRIYQQLAPYPIQVRPPPTPAPNLPQTSNSPGMVIIMPQGPTHYSLPPDRQIRGVTAPRSSQLAIMTMLQVLILDIDSGHIVHTIRRVSPPRLVLALRSLLLVHYNDNYCVLYDIHSYEAMYVIIGLPADHKGLKLSLNGRYLLYGNNIAIQLWSIPAATIDLVSLQYRYVSTYAIDQHGHWIFLGTYNGDIHYLKVMDTQLGKMPLGSQAKVHAQCVMGMEWLPGGGVISVDYGLEVVVSRLGQGGAQRVARLDGAGGMPKIVGVRMRGVNIYVSVDNRHYRLEWKQGQQCQEIDKVKPIEEGNGQSILVTLGNQDIMLVQCLSKDTFTLAQI